MAANCSENEGKRAGQLFLLPPRAASRYGYSNFASGQGHPGGMRVDGNHYLEGTFSGTSAYAIQHSVEYYEDPFSSRPERWIVDEKNGTTADSVAMAWTACCAFSLGSRGCAGKSMAYAELTSLSEPRSQEGSQWKFTVPRGRYGESQEKPIPRDFQNRE